MLRIFQLSLLICSLLCIAIAATFHEQSGIGISKSTDQFRVDSKIFAESITALGTSLSLANSRKPETIVRAKEALIKSRVAYKRIEYFLEYFFYTSSRNYNRAPKTEIEEPDLEYKEPAGLQYMEAMLFDSLPEIHKDSFQEQVKLLSLSANDLNSLLYQFPGTDAQILESLRIALVRIITLGITGFDAPQLKSGILESRTALGTIQIILKPYLEKSGSTSDSLNFYLKSSFIILDQHPDFDSFDRMTFLTENALPLQMHLGILINNLSLMNNRDGIMNYKAKNIFSKNALNLQSFDISLKYISEKEIVLGKRLFYESSLSGNSKKSCASCHNPNNYFMDGLVKSADFETISTVKRNAPSLFYATYQHSQFWDGRVKTLEEQIENVIKDPFEMSGNMTITLQNLNKSKKYKNLFKEAFNTKRKEKITEQKVYKAMASYIRTLNPFNSPFDQYMDGTKHALTDNQIAGFNLFMGKAQCGTCHFAPLFNGLIPPAYAFTEFEILGTTRSDTLAKPEYDLDNGRFDFKPTPYFKGAFKTPTVRNSAVTSPYMHNGAFNSLETLMEFYNQGGGAGLGLEVPNQTLSPAKLNLSEQEKSNIIEFLHALTDDINSN